MCLRLFQRPASHLQCADKLRAERLAYFHGGSGPVPHFTWSRYSFAATHDVSAHFLSFYFHLPFFKRI